MSKKKYPEKGMSDEEKEWLTRFKAGDPGARDEFFVENVQSVRFSAEKLLNGDPISSVIVEESFAKVWEKRPHYNSIKHLKNSFQLITRNACLNYLRSHSPSSIINIELADPESIDADPVLTSMRAQLLMEFNTALNEALGDLDEKSLLALVWSKVCDKSLKEISGKLDITPNYAGVLIHRAIALLRRKLDKWKGNHA